MYMHNNAIVAYIKPKTLPKRKLTIRCKKLPTTPVFKAAMITTNNSNNVRTRSLSVSLMICSFDFLERFVFAILSPL